MKRHLTAWLARYAIGVLLLLAFVCTVILVAAEQYVALGIFWGIILMLLLILPMLSAWLAKHLAQRLAEPLNKLYFEQALQQCPYPELQPMMQRMAELHRSMVAQRADLSDERNRLYVLVENMREGLVLTDADGQILIYNNAALQLLNTSQNGTPPLTASDLNSSSEFQTLMQSVLQGNSEETILYAGDTACQLFAGPVRTSVQENAQPDGVVLILLDVSEREKRDVLRREFTSNVSHELKTPLTSIYGIADMLATGMVKSEDVGGFALRIRDESSRMIALIEDIIRLSRLDDESFSAELVPLDLYHIAGAVLLQLRPAAECRHITITLHGSSAPIMGVPVIVEEMLYNLCDNAIKYNVDGGSVKLSVRCIGQHPVFTVSDTGIGIPAAERERIFERFYRVDKSHSRQIGGTGLGLSIVKHGAAFHNAVIDLHSTPNKGTEITLRFPGVETEMEGSTF